MSITLTTAFTTNEGNETDPAAAVMDMSMGFQAGQPYIEAEIQVGSVSGVTLVPGTVLGQGLYTLAVNLSSGVWSCTNPQGEILASGTLSGAALTSIVNSVKSLRNTAEAFIVANVAGALAGTQVAW